MLVDWVLHLEAHLLEVLRDHGAWVYVLLFAFIFVETGLVVMPFLPGDSLLFVTGTLAASGGLHLLGVLAVLIAAAVSGDAVNFAVGTWFRKQTEKKRRFRWPKLEHLRITNEFFERHGGKTIILARFVPMSGRSRPLSRALAGCGTAGLPSITLPGPFSGWSR